MKFQGKAEAVAATVLSKMESGELPAALANVFLTTGGRHADKLSWMNRVLIAMAGKDDAMSFGNKEGTTGWKSVGRTVKKGERCFHILGPCVRKVDDPKAEGGKRTIVYGFRSINYFGLDQTEVVDAEKWAKHNAANEAAERFVADLPLADVAKSWGLELKAYDGRKSNAAGWYAPGQAIAMGVENLATWAHELVHAADDRNGKLVERGQHWRSETVAELGGAILMMVMGYETEADLGGAYKYISKYAESAGIETIKACNEVLTRTCEAVATILEAADKLGDTVAVEATA